PRPGVEAGAGSRRRRLPRRRQRPGVRRAGAKVVAWRSLRGALVAVPDRPVAHLPRRPLLVPLPDADLPAEPRACMRARRERTASVEVARMKVGVTMFATDQAIAPAELARAAEERGFHSLYLPEHTHIPTSRRTPPPTGDAELAEEYRRTLDPFVALGAAAAVTTRLRLGTGVCLVAQRDPIVTAKAAATVDHVSGGRLVFGIGYGWDREEMRDHGGGPRKRRG